MIVLATVLFLAICSATARPLGSDPLTWTPHLNNETDRCTACNIIVGFVENTQKICTVVPKNMEAICEQLVHEYTPEVICKDLCVRINTYEINL